MLLWVVPLTAVSRNGTRLEDYFSSTLWSVFGLTLLCSSVRPFVLKCVHAFSAKTIAELPNSLGEVHDLARVLVDRDGPRHGCWRPILGAA